jgi:hypothetical protein
MSEALCGHDRPVGRPAAATVKSAPIGTVRPAVPAWCRPRQLPAERLGLLLGSVSGIALLGALAAPMPAAAQTWNNAGSSIWSNSANWTPNTVPNGSGVTAVINNGGTANVDASFTVGTLTVGGTSSVSINNNAALTVDGSIANAGTLSMNSMPISPTSSSAAARTP